MEKIPDTFTIEDMNECFYQGHATMSQYIDGFLTRYEGRYPSNWKDMDIEEKTDWFFEQYINEKFKIKQ
jgi:hypothetical protein